MTSLPAVLALAATCRVVRTLAKSARVPGDSWVTVTARPWVRRPSPEQPDCDEFYTFDGFVFATTPSHCVRRGRFVTVVVEHWQDGQSYVTVLVNAQERTDAVAAAWFAALDREFDAIGTDPF